MGINVSMSGSGSFGELAPGWSVNEFATPVTIGDSAGGTGSVNFSAKATDETLFVVNNNITTTEDVLGSISGVVKSVSESGIQASITHNNELALFDADLNIPALGAGGVVPAVDLCSQLTGRDIVLSQDSGYYYSLRGHSQGFDSTGAIASVKEWTGKVYDALPGLGWVRYTAQTGAIFGDKFFILNDDIWAGEITGDNFSDEFVDTSSRIAFKAMLNEETLQLNISSMLDSQFTNQNEGAFGITAYINPGSETISIYGEAVVAESWQSLTSSVSIAGLDLTQELSVFVEFKRPSSYSGTHTLTIIACNTSNYNVSVSTGVTYNGVRAYGTSWNIRNTSDFFIIGEPTTTSGVRGLYRAEDSGLPTAGYATVATNYILNPSFTSNVDNWNSFGNNGITLSQSTGGYVGTNCMKVSQTNSTNYTTSFGVFQRYDVQFIYPITVNIVSARIKGNSAGVKIYIEQYNSNDELIDSTFNSQYDYTSATYSYNDWRQISKGFALAPGVEYILVKFSGTSTEYFIDAVMLTNSPLAGTGYVPEYFDGDTTDNSTFTYSYDSDGYSVQQTPLSAINQEYENAKKYSYETLEIGPPASSVKSNAWQYIQDACSAYNQELSLVDNNIVIRETGTNVVNIDNIAGSPTITPNMTLTGRNVEIAYSESTSGYGSMYDGFADSNRVISVNAKEKVTTTVTLNGTPSILYAPKRIASNPPAGKMYPGQYAISAANGSLIPLDVWEDRGGRLEVSINKTIPNSADITLYGPTTDDNIFGAAGASYVGPYKLAYSDGGTEYSAINLAGSGVFINNKTLKLQTAADPIKVTQDVATTVTNPFISTLEQAYDRGIWAAQNAAGPRVTLSGTIPVSAISSFGLTAGSLISYRDSIYRITDATIGNLSISFNAVRHVTVEDFDLLWESYNVAAFDNLWEGYQTSDQSIKPLWSITPTTELSMLLDTDVVPYYELGADPEISVFPDAADMNPYYRNGGNLEDEDPVYLDVDNIPYDGGEGYGS